MLLVYFKNLWKVAEPILHPFLVFFSNLLITWNFQNKTYILTQFFNRNKPLKFDRLHDFGSRSFPFSIKSNFAYTFESWIPRLSGLLDYLNFNRWVLNLAKWQLLYASLSSCCHFAKFKAVTISKFCRNIEIVVSYQGYTTIYNLRKTSLDFYGKLWPRDQ